MKVSNSTTNKLRRSIPGKNSRPRIAKEILEVATLGRTVNKCESVSEALTYAMNRANVLDKICARPGQLSQAAHRFAESLKAYGEASHEQRQKAETDAELNKKMLALNGSEFSPTAFDAVKVMHELLNKARKGDLAAQTELNGLRTEQVNLFVKATSQFATLFFEEENLAEDDQPVIEIGQYTNEVKCYYIAQDGGGRSVLSVRAQKQQYFDMTELHSDEVVYPIRDINLGRAVNAEAKKTVDLAFDLGNRKDLDAYNILQTMFGTFNQSSGLGATWITNSRIKAANLPTGNLLGANSGYFIGNNGAGGGLLSDNSATTQFRLDVIRAIMQYCAQWSDIFGAPLRPTGVILVPSSEIYGLANEIKPTGQQYNPIATSLVSDYLTFEWFGVRWTLVPDVTLAPGTCYPVLNRPVGKIFRKPMLDQEFTETNEKKNIESRSMMQVLQFAVVEPSKPFVLKVIYHY